MDNPQDFKDILYDLKNHKVYLLLACGNVLVFNSRLSPCNTQQIWSPPYKIKAPTQMALFKYSDNATMGKARSISDNSLVFAGLKNGEIILLEASLEVKMRLAVQAHSAEVTSLKISFRGDDELDSRVGKQDRLVSCGLEGVVCIWSVALQNIIDNSTEFVVHLFCRAKLDFAVPILSSSPLFASILGDVLCTVTKNNMVQMYKIEDRHKTGIGLQPLSSNENDNEDNKITTLYCCSQLKLFVTIFADGLVKIWNKAGKILLEISTSTMIQEGVCFSNYQGDLLVASQHYLGYINVVCQLPITRLKKLVEFIDGAEKVEEENGMEPILQLWFDRGSPLPLTTDLTKRREFLKQLEIYRLKETVENEDNSTEDISIEQEQSIEYLERKYSTTFTNDESTLDSQETLPNYIGEFRENMSPNSIPENNLSVDYNQKNIDIISKSDMATKNPISVPKAEIKPLDLKGKPTTLYPVAPDGFIANSVVRALFSLSKQLPKEEEEERWQPKPVPSLSEVYYMPVDMEHTITWWDEDTAGGSLASDSLGSFSSFKRTDSFTAQHEYQTGSNIKEKSYPDRIHPLLIQLSTQAWFVKGTQLKVTPIIKAIWNLLESAKGDVYAQLCRAIVDIYREIGLDISLVELTIRKLLSQLSSYRVEVRVHTLRALSKLGVERQDVMMKVLLAILDFDEDVCKEASLAFKVLTGVSSRKKLTEWLAQRGIKLPQVLDKTVHEDVMNELKERKEKGLLGKKSKGLDAMPTSSYKLFVYLMNQKNPNYQRRISEWVNQVVPRQVPSDEDLSKEYDYGSKIIVNGDFSAWQSIRNLRSGPGQEELEVQKISSQARSLIRSTRATRAEEKQEKYLATQRAEVRAGMQKTTARYQKYYKAMMDKAKTRRKYQSTLLPNAVKCYTTYQKVEKQQREWRSEITREPAAIQIKATSSTTSDADTERFGPSFVSVNSGQSSPTLSSGLSAIASRKSSIRTPPGTEIGTADFFNQSGTATRMAGVIIDTDTGSETEGNGGPPPPPDCPPTDGPGKVDGSAIGGKVMKENSGQILAPVNRTAGDPEGDDPLETPGWDPMVTSATTGSLNHLAERYSIATRRALPAIRRGPRKGETIERKEGEAARTVPLSPVTSPQTDSCRSNHFSIANYPDTASGCHHGYEDHKMMADNAQRPLPQIDWRKNLENLKAKQEKSKGPTQLSESTKLPPIKTARRIQGKMRMVSGEPGQRLAHSLGQSQFGQSRVRKNQQKGSEGRWFKVEPLPAKLTVQTVDKGSGTTHYGVLKVLWTICEPASQPWIMHSNPSSPGSSHLRDAMLTTSTALSPLPATSSVSLPYLDDSKLSHMKKFLFSHMVSNGGQKGKKFLGNGGEAGFRWTSTLPLIVKPGDKISLPGRGINGNEWVLKNPIDLEKKPSHTDGDESSTHT